MSGSSDLNALIKTIKAHVQSTPNKGRNSVELYLQEWTKLLEDCTCEIKQIIVDWPPKNDPSQSQGANYIANVTGEFINNFKYFVENLKYYSIPANVACVEKCQEAQSNYFKECALLKSTFEKFEFSKDIPLLIPTSSDYKLSFKSFSSK